jgi:hypothetical protein
MGSKIRRGGRAWRVLLATGCLLGLLLLPGMAYAQDDTIEGEPSEWPDLGDAPSSFNNSQSQMTAYPAGGPPGVVASFPVCIGALSPDGYGMCHEWGFPLSFLGPVPFPSKSGEDDADLLPDDDGITNIDPSSDTADRDGHDDGVTFPAVLPECSPVKISVEGFLPGGAEVGPHYIEAWFDWNRDGDWNDGSKCGCGDDEWAIQDWPVTPDPVTGRFTASIPIVPCHPASDTDPLWVRVTLSPEQFVGRGHPWSAGGRPADTECLFGGETEDYYLTPETRREEFVPEPGSILLLGSGLAGLAGYATLRWRTRE